MNQNRQVFLNLDFFNDRLGKNPTAYPFRYGLSNLGNTCFMNSILNCLFGDLELCQLVLNPHHFDAYSSREERFQFIKHFSNLVRAASINQPVTIQSCIENFVKWVRSDTQDLNLFPKGQQADAHEFLVYLIRKLKEQFDLVLPALYPHQDRFETIFGEFQVGLGQLTYCERNHRSDMFVREMLSLDIEKNSNVQECLSEYFRPVSMMKCICSSNGYVHSANNPNCNPYRCDQCQSYVGATKILTINYLPSVLVLHLKRFRFDTQSRTVI